MKQTSWIIFWMRAINSCQNGWLILGWNKNLFWLLEISAKNDAWRKLFVAFVFCSYNFKPDLFRCTTFSKPSATVKCRKLQHSGRATNFVHELSKMVQNVPDTERLTFNLYRKVLFKVLTKVGINIVHFAWTRVSRLKPLDNICSKGPFVYYSIK